MPSLAASVLVVLFSPTAGFALDQAAPVTPSLVVSTELTGEKSSVTLTNTGSRPAVAWTIRIDATDVNGRTTSTLSSVDNFRAVALRKVGMSLPPGEGPFPPGGSPTIPITSAQGGNDVRVVLLATVLGNGLSEGDATQIDAIFAYREKVAPGIDRWLRLFAQPRQRAQSDQVDFLRQQPLTPSASSTDDEGIRLLRQLSREFALRSQLLCGMNGTPLGPAVRTASAS